METRKTKQRKVIRLCLWLIAVGIFLLALLPAWFPWVLAPLLKHFDLDYAQYRRVSYTRFALRDVTGNWASASLKLKRFEGDLPTAWLWKKFIHRTKGSAVFVLENGELTVAPPAATESGSQTNTAAKSLDRALNDTMQVVGLFEQYVPSAQLTNGSVLIASNQIQFPYGDWHNQQLETAVQLPDVKGDFIITARPRGVDFIRLSVKSDEYQSSLRGEFTNASEGWHWEGKATWLTNQAAITAQFPTHGWWPVKSQLRCENLVVPPRLLRPYGYQDLNAKILVEVSSDQFSLRVSGGASPTEERAQNGYPVADFSLAANGNPDSVNLTALHIQSAWLNANLTNSVGMTWSGELLAKPAQLQVALDLGKWPGAELTGRAEGLVQVTPRGRRPPVAQFNFAARQVHLRKTDVENLIVKGKYSSPHLRLEEFRADTADGSKLLASGSVDVHSQEVRDGQWKFSGTVLEKLFPRLSFDAMTGSGHVAGPLTNLTHQGEVKLAGFHAPKLAPLDVSAKWRGQQLRLDELETTLTAGKSLLALKGQVDLSALASKKISAIVTNLSFTRGGDELYVLQHPCALMFAAGETNVSPKKWSLAVNQFDWQGTNRSVFLNAQIAWPAQGKVAATATNVVLRDFSDFLTNGIPDASLDALNLAAHWSNGPVHSTVFIAGSLTNDAGKPFVLRGDLATGEKVFVNQLSIESGYTPTLFVTGNVPVMIIPGRAAGWLAWDQTQTIALTGAFAANGSQPVVVPGATYGRLTIQKPELSFHVSGTMNEPSASVQAAVEEMSWQPAATNSLISRMENFHLKVEVSRNRIKLDALNASLDGQPVHASGEWPLSNDDWRELWAKRRLPDWGKAEGQFQIEHLQMAAIARYLPQLLAPQGQLKARLELKPGRQFDGGLWLTNAASRPLGRISPLRDIDAQIRIEGQRAVLQEFRGQISGQPVQANGFVDLADRTGLKYQLNLSGTNVPLARSLEFLLRGNFNLQLRGGSNLPPVISGTIGLRDGLYVQHASALIWSGPKGTGLHPPYFSLTNQPLASWKLDLAIMGDRFLRVQTPVFNGVISANAKVRGDLRDPIITGDARIDSGKITFPFGTLGVDDGYVSLDGNDLNGPTLQLHASGRTLDYDVNLNVSGPADGAIIEFSSTPPLSSEEILLLLTVGEVPQQSNGLSTQTRMGQVATFLGKDLFSRFLGGGPGGDKLIINSGQDISEEGKMTYSVEYRFTDRWSIIGEYDRFNAYNASLKWRILSR